MHAEKGIINTLKSFFLLAFIGVCVLIFSQGREINKTGAKMTHTKKPHKDTKSEYYGVSYNHAFFRHERWPEGTKENDTDSVDLVYIWETEDGTVYVGSEPEVTDFKFKTWTEATRYVEDEGYDFRGVEWV